MSTTGTETAPGTWDDARDVPFFTMTARLFAPEFCLGASVLLASHDDEAGAGRGSGSDEVLVGPGADDPRRPRGLAPRDQQVV
jgi:hypothetical protein